MGYTLKSHTSPCAIHEVSNCYQVTVGIDVSYDKPQRLPVQLVEIGQSGSVTTPPTWQTVLLIPKSDVRDEADLLALAECTALTQFIEESDEEAVKLFDPEVGRDSVYLEVSQTLSALLLANFLALVERVKQTSDPQEVRTSVYAAIKVYFTIEARRTRSKLSSSMVLSNDVTKR